MSAERRVARVRPRRSARRALACLALALAWCGCASAATTCTVSATGVAFGVYDPLSPVPRDTTGVITVRCTLTRPPVVDMVDYTVQLGPGSSGTPLARTLRFGAHTLAYNLYANAARTQIWGNGSSGTTTVGDRLMLIAPLAPATQERSHTVYGRIPAGQDPAPGEYADTIVVTVTF